MKLKTAAVRTDRYANRPKKDLIGYKAVKNGWQTRSLFFIVKANCGNSYIAPTRTLFRQFYKCPGLAYS